MIKLRSVNKYFNKDRQNEIHVLNDVDIDLPERGMVAVFGKSGCGKTTLLNVIGGLDGFSSGSVEIENVDIRKDTDNIRNKYIGYIFQNYNLNNSQSCYENVANALRLCGLSDAGEIDRRVIAALSCVGMAQFKNRPPDTLSGGQQQRIAIARAIVKNPRIILADEPTGNLDEANTVAIMDLLKEIAKEHLVILVTHEANLVDHYCDKVIELSDGKIVSVRDNDCIGNYSVRNKNDIFLGEFDKSELADANSQVEYYGQKPEEPIKLKIVNNGGKLYLRVDTPGVHLVDGASEIKFRDGVFEHGEKSAERSAIDMSELTPVSGKKYGSLFSFGSAVKSGYKVNFGDKKRGKKFLRRLLGLFAAVFVLVGAFFGTAFKNIADVNRAYNHNAFYVYVPDEDASTILTDAAETGKGGIDYVAISGSMLNYYTTVRLVTGYFETFSSRAADSSFMTNLIIADNTVCDGKIVAGRKTDLSDYEAVISTAAADDLLSKSVLGYIDGYEDLVGLTTSNITVDGNRLRIVGVVKADEPIMYLTELSAAKAALSMMGTYAFRAADYGMTVNDGETVLVHNNASSSYPKADDAVTIHGKTFRISRDADYTASYDKWLAAEYGDVEDISAFIDGRIFDDFPDISENSAEYELLYAEYLDKYYFDYTEYYYSRFDEYMSFINSFDKANDMYIWLAVEKGIDAAKYIVMDTSTQAGDGYDLFWALEYKEKNGTFPTYTLSLSERNGYIKLLKDYVQAFADKYEYEYSRYYYYVPPLYYLLSDSDLIALSKQIGMTDRTASALLYYATEAEVPFGGMYVLVHSSDPVLTSDFLSTAFDELADTTRSAIEITSPADIRKELMSEVSEGITRNIISLVVIVALMSVCMYFIMRSSLLVRIKEIGIYRAIGVSKKNMMFKFFVEVLLLTTLTVFVGYLVMSVIMAMLCSTPLMSAFLYYPVWFALAILAALYAVCLVCGLLPIISLLKKTPSEILAKYDI